MTEMLTLGKAAQLAGVSRSKLTQAISEGRLPASREDNWVYRIDPRDLGRVFAIPGLIAASGPQAAPQDDAAAAAAREEARPSPVLPLADAMPPPKPTAAAPITRPASFRQRVLGLLGIGRSARA
jgi:hypothetical protein